MRTHLLLALSLLLLAAPATADEVRLTNGGSVEGHATRDGDHVVVVTPAGEIRLRAEEVAEIVPGKTRHDLYREKAEALRAGEDDTDPDAHVALGDWCKEQGLGAEARRHWRRAVELDDAHRTAHARLGHIRYEGRWVTEDEYYTARGFVQRDGQWVERAQVEREEAEREARRAAREHERTIREAVARMASMKRKTRLAAKVALQRYAEEREDLRLAAFASEVADHYNAQWRAVKVALSHGSVLTEIRATQARLKRPIPELQTSLGALSTPVRIQLPELDVVSVRTTVLVPADIELDEDD